MRRRLHPDEPEPKVLYVRVPRATARAAAAAAAADGVNTSEWVRRLIAAALAP